MNLHSQSDPGEMNHHYKNSICTAAHFTATASLELVQSLSSCRHLTVLYLEQNKLGEAGHQLAQSIRSWGDEPPLQELYLYELFTYSYCIT